MSVHLPLFVSLLLTDAERAIVLLLLNMYGFCDNIYSIWIRILKIILDCNEVKWAPTNLAELGLVWIWAHYWHPKVLNKS